MDLKNFKIDDIKAKILSMADKKTLIKFGIGFVIGLLAYLLADGSIDPKSLKYGVTTIIARLAGAGGNIVIAYIILILTSITVLEIRKLVFKSN